MKKLQNISSKAGFIGIVGEPNAGKSSLINWLLGEKLLLVSKKANATRKRTNAIVMHGNSQLILVDTPGIHEKEKLLNKFMLNEALKTLVDSDLLLYVADVRSELKGYKHFLELNEKKIPHILVLTKIDLVEKETLDKKLLLYAQEGVPLKTVAVSSTTDIKKSVLLDEIAKYLPVHPFLYDPELLTTEHIRDIYKELIRESLFNELEEEIPYESDVIIERIVEKRNIDKIYAQIITQTQSQKSMIIGKNGRKIKKLGIIARELLETFANKKIYLELYVKCVPNWTKNKRFLEDEVGYSL